MTTNEYLHLTRPSYNLEYPYNPIRDNDGRVVIDNTFQAIRHYYRGKGEQVVLGPKTVEMIKNSKDVQYYINRIVKGLTDGPAEGERGIDLRKEGFWRGFHLGRMTFTYHTTCKDGN